MHPDVALRLAAERRMDLQREIRSARQLGLATRRRARRRLRWPGAPGRYVEAGTGARSGT